MSDKGTLSLLNEAFGKTDSSLTFDTESINSESRYVAWIDIMGAGPSMQRSLTECSAKIGQFDAAILNAYYSLPHRDGLTVHSMTDGAYVTSASAGDLRKVLTAIMVQLARYFLGISHENKFVVRCAVAFGDVVTSDTMIAQLKQSQCVDPDDNSLLRNVMLGGPFAQAHDKESCAAPFGIFVDSSAIGPDRFASDSAWKWWNPTNADRELFVLEFRQCLLKYFRGLEENFYKHMIPASKILEYNAKIKSYFQTDPILVRVAKEKHEQLPSAGSLSGDSSED